MGYCDLCGQKAGFWIWQHEECGARRAAGRAEMVDMVAEAVLQPRKRSKLSARLAAVASSSFLTREPLKTFYVLGWEKAAAQVLDARSPDDPEERPHVMAAEDELVSLSESRALFSFAERFGLEPGDLDERGAHTRFLQSVAIRQILWGMPPTVSDRADQLPAVLQKGETLIWPMWDTDYAELRTHTYYVGASDGFSIRLAKGLYYRHSKFKGYPVSMTGPEVVGTGPLYVTDRNLYFVSFNKTVRINYAKVIGLIPYADGFAIYTDGRGGKPHAFCTGDGWFACNLVANLIWQRRDGAPRKTFALPAPAPLQLPAGEGAAAGPEQRALGAAGAQGRGAAGARTGAYSPLRDFLEAQESDYLTLSFDDVATIIGRPLPASAYRHNAWWANNLDHTHARAWMDAGWRTQDLSLTAERVTFVRV
jgi:hypothetical protein